MVPVEAAQRDLYGPAADIEAAVAVAEQGALQRRLPDVNDRVGELSSWLVVVGVFNALGWLMHGLYQSVDRSIVVLTAEPRADVGCLRISERDTVAVAKSAVAAVVEPRLSDRRSSRAIEVLVAGFAQRSGSRGPLVPTPHTPLAAEAQHRAYYANRPMRCVTHRAE